MKKEGGWIFISHSHKDIEIARKIRNRFEELGFDPLLFFLKCLNEDSEIEHLIKREIDEREWFVYIDSENSRNSKWVASERAYIEKSGTKNILNIDINENYIARAESIANRLSVYVAHSHFEKSIAEKFRKELLKNEFLVLQADNTEAENRNEYTTQVYDKVESAAKHGFVIILLKEESMNTYWVRHEFDCAVTNFATIVPVCIGDTKLTRIYNRRCDPELRFAVSPNPADEEIESVVSSIKKRILQTLKNKQ